VAAPAGFGINDTGASETYDEAFGAKVDGAEDGFASFAGVDAGADVGGAAEGFGVGAAADDATAGMAVPAVEDFN
jgi:hypothetical protein